MNKKLLIGILILLILAVIAFMVKDLFLSKNSQENPYELKTDNLKGYDTTLISHKEIFQIPVEMDELHGIAIDNNDNIIVAGSKLILYDKSFTQISKFDLKGIASCVAVNEKGEIYLALQNHIEVWNQQGKMLKQWKTTNPNSIFTGIAVNETSVFITDATERIMHHYDLNGSLINNIGGKDSLKGIPQVIIRSGFYDVALGRDNEIWMTNPGAYLLEAFDENGNLKSSWGEFSKDKIEGFCGCCNPTNFIVMDDGSFVTAEKAFPRIKIYSAEGKFVSIVAGTDKFNDRTKGMDLAKDSQNRIYVLDPMRKQIRIFEKK